MEDVNIFNLFFLRVQAATVAAPTGINSTRLYGRFRVYATMFAGKLAVPKC